MLAPAKRLRELDILRATAIFSVVLFHLPTDLNWQIANGGVVSTVFGYAVSLGLALFFFLSGFAIDLNNKGITTRNDTGTFFGKRAKRIYPLYWVALTSSFLALLALLPLLHTSLSQVVQAGFIDQKTYDLSISGVVICFLGAQVLLYPRFIDVPNRWFVGTILICYLLYPIIAYFGKNDIKRILLVSIALVLCLLAARATLDIVGDDRLYLYLAFFVGGIIASRADLFYSGVVKKRVVASFSLLVPLLILARVVLGYPAQGAYLNFGLGPSLNYAVSNAAGLVYTYTIGFLFIIVAFYVAKTRAPALGPRAAAFFFCAATASYAVFLFNQQFVVGLRLALERLFHLGPVETGLIIIFIGLPVLFSAAFYEQRAEPSAVNKAVLSIKQSSLWKRLRAPLRRA
jgi:peptidoglycan/LPS O-acetylase OafA/YrhL